MRYSDIDFCNTREIYTHLKSLESMEIKENPIVFVDQSINRIITLVIFTYKNIEVDQALKLMNSFFLDLGFINFGIRVIKSLEDEVSLGIYFRVRK